MEKQSSNFSGGAYEWQKIRRKNPSDGAKPMQGFGPRGEYTLYLTPAEVTKRVAFKNGKPTIEIAGPAHDDDELRSIRAKLLHSMNVVRFGGDGRAILSIDLTLLEYAATLISRHYNVSDEDLTLLLPLDPKSKWFDVVITHALGGVENRNALATAAKPMPPDMQSTPPFAQVYREETEESDDVTPVPIE